MIPRTDSPFPIVVMHVDPLPHAIEAVGIALRERVDGDTVAGFQNEKTPDRRFAVTGHQGPGRRHGDTVAAGLVEMDAVGAVMFGPDRERIRPIDCMNDEVHSVFSYGQSVGCIGL
jgi:hypothetical protein